MQQTARIPNLGGQSQKNRKRRQPKSEEQKKKVAAATEAGDDIKEHNAKVSISGDFYEDDDDVDDVDEDGDVDHLEGLQLLVDPGLITTKDTAFK
eukprot:CAMPEP_0171915948 /NCGR_PEP_ID=MMETSP0993-20121228/14413_1 /TAXON_ID=483369 /ORGANISM="non described non described, Strain CCMP2098" /LENGTH=94 /DNA_ID=CAMNT_0012551193 /DNA_START=383 /DNA_END=667 /DNA_ORIENTATION=+